MRVAAGIVAVLAWGGLLAAVWYPVVAGVRPSPGMWLGVIFVSVLVGLVVPAFLLELDKKPPGATGPTTRQRRADGPRWVVSTSSRSERPSDVTQREE